MRRHRHFTRGMKAFSYAMVGVFVFGLGWTVVHAAVTLANH